MAITLSQSVLGSTSYPPPAASFVSNVPIGDYIVCAVITPGGQGNPGTVSVADSVNTGNYTVLNTYYDSTNTAYVALFGIVANAGGMPTVTATLQNGQGGQIIIADFTGFTGTITVDSALVGTAEGTGTAVSLTPVTNANANELILCAAYVNFGWASSPPSGWTGASTTQTGLYYAVVASASQNTPFTGTLGSSAAWDVAVAGLYGKAASSGGGANILLLGV